MISNVMTFIKIIIFIRIFALKESYAQKYADFCEEDFCELNVDFSEFESFCHDSLLDDNEGANDFQAIFTYGNTTYIVFKDRIWPIEFNKNGYPIVEHRAIKFSNLFKNYKIPKNRLDINYIYLVAIFKDHIFVHAFFDSKSQIYVAHIPKYHKAEYMNLPIFSGAWDNNKAKEIHKIFDNNILDDFVIQSIFTIPKYKATDDDIEEITLASLSKHGSPRIDRLKVFNLSGDVNPKNYNINLLDEVYTRGAFIYEYKKEKGYFKYLVFDNKGFMCRETRSLNTHSVFFDNIRNKYDSHDCEPFHTIFGCPQKFCYRSNIDDFNVKQNYTGSKHINQYFLFRGPYFWLYEKHEKHLDFPLKMPKSGEAKLIRKQNYYPNLFDHIEASFSIYDHSENSDLSYFFKDDKFLRYKDGKLTKTDIIGNEFLNFTFNHINAAMYYNKTAFIFDEEYVHLFKRNKLNQWHYTNFLAIVDNFTGLPKDIDAVLQVHKHSYVTKNNFYYEINMEKWFTGKMVRYHSKLLISNEKQDNSLFRFECEGDYMKYTLSPPPSAKSKQRLHEFFTKTTTKKTVITEVKPQKPTKLLSTVLTYSLVFICGFVMMIITIFCLLKRKKQITEKKKSPLPLRNILKIKSKK